MVCGVGGQQSLRFRPAWRTRQPRCVRHGSYCVGYRPEASQGADPEGSCSRGSRSARNGGRRRRWQDARGVEHPPAAARRSFRGCSAAPACFAASWRIRSAWHPHGPSGPLAESWPANADAARNRRRHVRSLGQWWPFELVTLASSQERPIAVVGAFTTCRGWEARDAARSRQRESAAQRCTWQCAI